MSNQLAIILPSVILSVVILLLLMVVIVLILLRRHQTPDCQCDVPDPKVATPTTTNITPDPSMYENEIQFVRANLRKVRNTISATNPLSITDSLDVKE